MKYLTVFEVAEKLGVTHTTIYNKLKNKEIYKSVKIHIKTVNNTRLFSDEIIEILRPHIVKKSKKIVIDDRKKNVDNINYLSLHESLISNLKDRITELEKDKDDLKKYIENQDKDKDDLKKHIETQARLIENSQVLLREAQKKLEEPITKNKSFWKKIFK
jgi:predicted DNA-binding transcriptional regulator AlpA